MDAAPRHHREFLAALDPEVRARLVERADTPGLGRFVLHVGVAVLLGAYIATGQPGYPLAMVAQGFVLVFLFTALHESIHGTAFRRPWLNSAIAWFAGAVVFLAPGWFRYYHFAHHRHTHDPTSDPELLPPKKPGLWRHLLYMTGVPEFLDRPRVILRNALGPNRDSFVPAGARDAVRREARVLVGVYLALAAASVAAGSTLLLWVWIGPLLLGGPFLRAYLLAEHSGCPHVTNAFENTRTTFTNGLMRFFAWNMPYHAEHHVHPAVPFHRLPALHALVAPHLAVTERGYVRFNLRYLRALLADAPVPARGD